MKGYGRKSMKGKKTKSMKGNMKTLFTNRVMAGGKR